ncbi:cytochrome c [Microvirga sp. TS319]|uniref:c-type cytochrome n=1 Tax=Microvirga sp. TS319 TaxID=3241165 RepID=UPI00351A3253
MESAHRACAVRRGGIASIVAAGALLAVLPAAAQSVAPPGAAACSGCHPPPTVSGAVVPPLQGQSAEEIVAAMQAFRTGQRPATVMDRIAKGFTDDETRAIAAWVSQQH